MADTAAEGRDPILIAAESIQNRLDADVILFNKPISESSAARLHGVLEETAAARANVFLLLVTYGGDAHAAYTIARDLQHRYQKITICIAGDCYSAGTLIVLCAHELVISDRGRLGPLDVQLPKRDELLERLSGLAASSALDELKTKAFETFVHFATELKLEFGRQISFRTALDLAGTITGQMYGEIYKQIDPIRLAEDARMLHIASHYGGILGKTSGNLKARAVSRLLEDYPSHECIIDRNEAKELFTNVRSPEADERDLVARLGPFATEAVGDAADGHILVFPDNGEPGGTHEDNDNRQVAAGGTQRGRAGSKPGGAPVPGTGNGSTGGAPAATSAEPPSH